jgi:hypothetical protein
MKYTNKDKELVRSLLIIRNKGCCEYTHWRAAQEFRRIKFKLAERIGSGTVIYLGHELLDVDPTYPDCNLSKHMKSSFANTVNGVICRIASPEEALKYMKEYRPLTSHYDNFTGWHEWIETIEDTYPESGRRYSEIRHDDTKIAKWRKFNNF